MIPVLSPGMTKSLNGKVHTNYKHILSYSIFSPTNLFWYLVMQIVSVSFAKYADLYHLPQTQYNGTDKSKEIYFNQQKINSG